MTSASTFTFLNVTADVQRPDDWDDSARPKLWRYNLHYFDDLNARDAAARDSWHRALLARWVRENPAAQGPGWDPYPTSLRIVNWIKWALCAAPGGEPRLDSLTLDSLATQARWVRKRLEVHLLGNHLWANAKAMAFAGAFFQGAEAQIWLDGATALLNRELGEQILTDGGHFERSPMYHAILVEDVLDLVNLSRVFPAGLRPDLVARLRETAVRMLRWLRVMTHPDGNISFFNDAAFAVAPNQLALDDYAHRLGITESVPLNPLEPLSDSGYVRLQNDRAVVICDVGSIGPDYLPAHAHADTLSFELSLDGRRVVVNSGTSTYEPGLERRRQRSTAAHNTVVVDGQNSSDVWGSFRVARRARPFEVAWGATGDGPWLEGSHDGYQRLRGRVTHRRRWGLGPNGLRIDDHLDGRFGSACARWHFAPDVEVSAAGDPDRWRLRSSDGPSLELLSVPTVGTSPEASTWHPEFGQAVTNVVLPVPFEGPALVTRFSW